MNSYDYYFNGVITDINIESKSKFSLMMNNLKWFTYLLIFFNLLQIFFFMGNSIFSIIIVIYIFYVSYIILFKILNDKDLNFEFDHSSLLKQLRSLGINILFIVLFCILDLGFGIVFMNDYYRELFQSENNFEYYFVIFVTYLNLVRLGLLCYLSFHLKFCHRGNN